MQPRAKSICYEKTDSKKEQEYSRINSREVILYEEKQNLSFKNND